MVRYRSNLTKDKDRYGFSNIFNIIKFNSIEFKPKRTVFLKYKWHKVKKMYLHNYSNTLKFSATFIYKQTLKTRINKISGFEFYNFVSYINIFLKTRDFYNVFVASIKNIGFVTTAVRGFRKKNPELLYTYSHKGFVYRISNNVMGVCNFEVSNYFSICMYKSTIYSNIKVIH